MTNLQITSRLLVLIYTIIFHCVFLIVNVYFTMSCLRFILENETVEMCIIESFGFSTCGTQICHSYNYILMPFIIWPADILSSLHLILMHVMRTINNSHKSVFLFEYCSVYVLAFKATEVCYFCFFILITDCMYNWNIVMPLGPQIVLLMVYLCKANSLAFLTR